MKISAVGTGKILPGLLVALWLLAVVAGMGRVVEYKTTPGEAGHAAPRWPAATRLSLSPEGFTLVLALHPRCVCSRASVAELARLLAAASGRIHTEVLILEPAGAGADFPRTSLRSDAAALPGAVLVDDFEGREAALFGARTSGSAFLYESHGRLLFAGGLTSARGHEGTSAGTRRILDLVRGRNPDGRSAPVFGCSLGLGTAGPGAPTLVATESTPHPATHGGPNR